jgi:hypothetical protein
VKAYSEKKARRKTIAFCLALLAILLPVSRALGQPKKSSCPGLEAKAGAEEQAVCWFEKDERGSDACKAGTEGVGSCILQAIGWCADAAFDAAPVANACFMAYIRAGKLDAAGSVAEYLQSPSEAVAQCRRALSVVSVRVVTNPSGAEVTMDGRDYGLAPVEIKLAGDWRKSEITARFASGHDVVASQKELLAAFNRRACVMGDLVIKGPEPAPSAAPSAAQFTPEQSVQSLTTTQTDKVEKSHGISISGLILAGLGGATVITGGVLLMLAESSYSKTVNSKDDTPWLSRKADYESVKPLRISGGIVLGVGVALGVVGTVLMLLSGSESTSASSERPSVRMSSRDFSLRWSL